MSSRPVDDFLVLAETGNFSRAAQARHVTQPAFSRRVRALEEWLGVSLFDRSTHPVTLTETGQWFKAVATEIRRRDAERYAEFTKAQAAYLKPYIDLAKELGMIPQKCQQQCPQQWGGL